MSEFERDRVKRFLVLAFVEINKAKNSLALSTYVSNKKSLSLTKTLTETCLAKFFYNNFQFGVFELYFLKQAFND